MAVVSVVALISASAAAAGAPLVRTLATAHAFGHVTVGASTDQIKTRLWIQRIGGSGIAHGSGSTICTRKTVSGSTGEEMAFSFNLRPGSRQTLWRAGGSSPCVVTVSLRGRDRLAVALRGY